MSMLHIPLTIKKLHELEKDNDPEIIEKKYIFKCLERNLNFKKKYEIMSMGSHGVVISPHFTISIDSQLQTLSLKNQDFISKILDLHMEDKKYIEKEICISKKLKILDEKYENFIYPSSYEKIDKYCYNIIMKKGFDFESNLLQLNFKQLLHTLYNLIHSIHILSDNNILLLDIKPNNFLFSNIKDDLYKSVIIDFGGELLIEDMKDFDRYLDNFEFFCHDFWPIELTILLHRIGLRKKHINIQGVIKDYDKMLKDKLGKNNLNEQVSIYNRILSELDKIKTKKYSELYQKIMLYQIGKSWIFILYKYKKKLKLSKIQFSIFKTIIEKITKEQYFERFNIIQIKKLLSLHINNNDNFIKIDKIL